MNLFRMMRRFGLFVVTFAMPLSAFKFLDFAYALTPFKLATAFLLVLAGIQVGLQGVRPRHDSKAFVVLGFVVMLAISLVPSIIMGYPPVELVIKASTIMSLVLFYFLLNYVANDRDDLVLVMWAFVLGSAATAFPTALGLQQAETVSRAGERFAGLSGQVNIFGFDMMMALPLALALFLATRSTLRRTILIGAALLITIGLMLSLSRSALVSAGAIWVLGIYRFRRPDSIKYIIPTFLCGILFLVFMPESLAERVESFTDPNQRARDGSIQARLFQFEFALRAFLSNPVIGVGYLGIPLWAEKQPGLPGLSHVIHNAYLRILAEQGLLGFLLYVGVLTGAWFQLTRSWVAARARRMLRDPLLTELGQYAIFLQLALFGSIVAGMFTHTQKAKSAWLVIALATIVHGLVRQRVQELDGRPAAIAEDDWRVRGAPGREQFPARATGPSYLE